MDTEPDAENESTSVYDIQPTEEIVSIAFWFLEIDYKCKI